MPNPTFTSQVMAALGRLKLFLTAQLPSTPPTGLLVYDTTTDSVKVANNAGAFTVVGGGGALTPGTTVVTGGVNQVLFADAAGNLNVKTGFLYTTATDVMQIPGTGAVQVPDGAVATPSLGFTGATTTGFSRAANTLDASVAGVGVMRFIGGGFLTAPAAGDYGWSASTTAGGQDTSLLRTAAGVVSVGTGVAGIGWMRSPSGELALNADYTNATAGFTATNLSATVISGRTYFFECCLFFSDSTAADGAQFDFNGGGAAATNFRAQAFAYNNVGGALVLTNGAVTALATAIQVALALTTQSMLVVKGTFVPSGSGTFIVRAAQTAHTAGTLTVNRGSYLNLRDANPL